MRRCSACRQVPFCEAFEHIVRNRSAPASKFASDVIPESVLCKILELTQLSPSSFNLQPYKMIVVRSREARDALSSAMLGSGNIAKVREAPLTVVFAADKEPGQLTRKLMKLELEHGTDPSYVSTLPSKISFLLGKGFLSNAFRATATHLMSPISPSPTIAANCDAWAAKNASLAAQTYMLGASAFGLSTAPMEGFDERRIFYLLGIPQERYSVPLVVATGYALTLTRPPPSSSSSDTNPNNTSSSYCALPASLLVLPACYHPQYSLVPHHQH